MGIATFSRSNEFGRKTSFSHRVMRAPLLGRLAPLLLLFIGLYATLGHWLLGESGAHFGRIVLGDLGDTRFNLYLLEHSYRWLHSSPLHRDFWSPPFFSPHPGVTAYSDTLITVAPVYWLWRNLGFQPYHALHLWLASMSICNFIVCYFFLSHVLKCDRLGSTCGAYLFTFANSRWAHLSHIQLIPHFFALLSLYFAIRYLREPQARLRRASIFALCLVSQAYASFYLAWFVGIIGVLFLLVAYSLPESRRQLLQYPQPSWQSLFFAASLLVAGLLPLALRYLQASADVGLRSTGEIDYFLPPLAALGYHGSAHLLYPTVFQSLIETNVAHEHQLGFGFITLMLALVGLLVSIPRTWRIPLLATLLLCSILTGVASLWLSIAPYLPGGLALRAIGRIHLSLLLIWSIGIAALVSHVGSLAPISTKTMLKKNFLLAALVLALIAEQIRTPHHFDSGDESLPVSVLTQAMVQASPSCQVFYYASTGGKLEPWRYHLDMMWAGIHSGRAVINGYSGNSPPQWELYDCKIRSKSDRPRIYQALKDWSNSYGLAMSETCWLLPSQDAEANPLVAYPLAQLTNSY